MDMNLPRKMTVQSHTIDIVPRYAETDKGGVIHHSVYPVWFEMGRTELLRVNGVAYKDLENQTQVATKTLLKTINSQIDVLDEW